MLDLFIGFIKKSLNLLALIINRGRTEQEPKYIDGLFSSYKINPIKTGYLSIDSEIQKVYECPALLPDIKVHVFDDTKHEPLAGKLVSIELKDYKDTDYLSGKLEKITNKHGEVVFKGLKVSCTGRYELIVKSDNRETVSATFYVSTFGDNQPASILEDNLPLLPEYLAKKYTLTKAIRQNDNISVYSAQDIEHKCAPVSITIYNHPSTHFIKSVNAIQELKWHPNIIYTDSYTDESRQCLYIIKEQLPSLATSEKKHDAKSIQHIGTEICRALNYIYSQRVYCYKIKPENICIQNGHYKYDFLVGEETQTTVDEKTAISSLGYLLYYLYQSCTKTVFNREEIKNELESIDDDGTKLIEVFKKASIFNDDQRYKNITSVQLALKTINTNTKPIKYTKKTILCSIGITVLVVIAIGVLLFSGMQIKQSSSSNDLIPKASDGNAIHIILKVSSDEYENAKAIIQERLAILAGKDYLCLDNKEQSDYVTKVMDIYIPINCFNENHYTNILDNYIVYSSNIYIINQLDKEQRTQVTNNDLESISVKTGNLSNNGSTYNRYNIDNYKYIEIKLKDEFVNQYKSKFNSSLYTFVHDIQKPDFYLKSAYTYTTIPLGDGKTFYVLSQESDDKFVDLLYYNFTNSDLFNTIEYTFDINFLVEWENPEDENLITGKLQCAFDAFSEETETFFLTQDYPIVIANSEDTVDYRAALTKRLDALGEPYALGWGYDPYIEKCSDEIYTVAIKTKLNHINDDIKRLIGKHNDIRIQSQSCFGYTDIENWIKLDRDGRAFVDFDVDNLPFLQTEEMFKLSEAASIDNNDLLYIVCDNYPIMQFSAIHSYEHNTIPANCCHISGGIIRKLDLSEDNKWYSNFIATLIRTNHQMKANFYYDQYYPEDDLIVYNSEEQKQYNPSSTGNMPDLNKYAPLISTGQEELETFVKTLHPEASVDYCAGMLYIKLYVRVSDQFPRELYSFVSFFLQEVISGHYYIKNISIDLYDIEEPQKYLGSLDYTKPSQSISSNESVESLVAKGRNLKLKSIYVCDKLEQYEIDIDDMIETANPYIAKPLFKIPLTPYHSEANEYIPRVYTGPSESYIQARGTHEKDIISVAGYYRDWTLIEYETATGNQLGYIHSDNINGKFPNLSFTPYAGIIMDYSGEASTCQLTDGFSHIPLDWGTPVTILGEIDSERYLNNYLYIETVLNGKPIRGIVPSNYVTWVK